MKDLSKLENLLSLAAEDSRKWDAVCEEVDLIFDAQGTLLPDSNPNFRGMWTAASKPARIGFERYLEDGWMRGDPREKVLNAMFDKGYCTDDEIFPDRKKRFEMPIYRDLLLDLNFGNVLMVRLLTPEGYWPMTIHMANDREPLGPEDFSLVEKVQEMFAEATKKASQIAHKAMFDFFEFMDAAKTEVFVFDADGNQSFTLDSSGQIQTRNQLERILPNDISVQIQEELKSALLSDPNQSISQAYQFTKNGTMVNVLVIQIPTRLRHFFMKFKTCAVRTELGVSSALKHTRLRDNYGLTDTDIITIEMLVSGKTTAMISELMSLKQSTVRQRLKLIYEKTTVGSQVELIALYREI